MTYVAGMIEELLVLARDPHAWAALVTLIVMEVVLGIDNLIFISILSNKLPEQQRRARAASASGWRVILRLALLGGDRLSIVQLTTPLFTAVRPAFSWRDLILIAGGLFLVWKATKEIHHNVDPAEDHDVMDGRRASVTASGRDRPDPAARPRVLDRQHPDRRRHDRASADHGHRRGGRGGLMLLAADPLANFIDDNPTW